MEVKIRGRRKGRREVHYVITANQVPDLVCFSSTSVQIFSNLVGRLREREGGRRKKNEMEGVRQRRGREGRKKEGGRKEDKKVYNYYKKREEGGILYTNMYVYTAYYYTKTKQNGIHNYNTN